MKAKATRSGTCCATARSRRLISRRARVASRARRRARALFFVAFETRARLSSLGTQGERFNTPRSNVLGLGPPANDAVYERLAADYEPEEGVPEDDTPAAIIAAAPPEGSLDSDPVELTLGEQEDLLAAEEMVEEEDKPPPPPPDPEEVAAKAAADEAAHEAELAPTGPRQLVFGAPHANHLELALVGLTSSGKTSLYDALRGRADRRRENFPFATLRPSRTRILVPDARFDWLARRFRAPPAARPSLNPEVRLTDTPGLAGANAVRAKIGPVGGMDALAPAARADALYVVVRAFDGDETTHVEGEVDPARDVRTVARELVAHDANVVSFAMQALAPGLRRNVGGAAAKAEYKALEKARDWLVQQRRPLRLAEWELDEIALLEKHALLTTKEVIFLLNLDKRDYLRKRSVWLPRVEAVVALASVGGGPIVPFCAAFERDVATEHPPPWAPSPFTSLAKNPKTPRSRPGTADAAAPTVAGAIELTYTARSAAPRILQQPYLTLGLVRVYTCTREAVCAWSVRDGTNCVELAHHIHAEIARNFNAAEIMFFDDLHELGSEEMVRRQGKLRQQGRAYVVEDGVIFFVKFKVPPDDQPGRAGPAGRRLQRSTQDSDPG